MQPAPMAQYGSAGGFGGSAGGGGGGGSSSAYTSTVQETMDASSRLSQRLSGQVFTFDAHTCRAPANRRRHAEATLASQILCVVREMIKYTLAQTCALVDSIIGHADEARLSRQLAFSLYMTAQSHTRVQTWDSIRFPARSLAA